MLASDDAVETFVAELPQSAGVTQQLADDRPPDFRIAVELCLDQRQLAAESTTSTSSRPAAGNESSRSTIAERPASEATSCGDSAMSACNSASSEYARTAGCSHEPLPRRTNINYPSTSASDWVSLPTRRSLSPLTTRTGEVANAAANPRERRSSTKAARLPVPGISYGSRPAGSSASRGLATVAQAPCPYCPKGPLGGCKRRLAHYIE